MNTRKNIPSVQCFRRKQYKNAMKWLRWLNTVCLRMVERMSERPFWMRISMRCEKRSNIMPECAHKTTSPCILDAFPLKLYHTMPPMHSMDSWITCILILALLYINRSMARQFSIRQKHELNRAHRKPLSTAHTNRFISRRRECVCFAMLSLENECGSVEIYALICFFCVCAAF